LLPRSDAGEQPEETVLRRFSQGLDNRFFMLRKLQFESSSPPFPPILVGPTGLFVLNVSRAKGFFRAKETSWWEADKRTHRFNPAHPNLIKQSLEYATKLATILEAHGKSHPEITPILVLADPGANVETTNPAIRIVRMDGVENLISNIILSEEILEPNEINALADSLEIMANPEKAIPMGEGEDFFGRDLLLPEKKPKLKIPSIPTGASIPPVEKKLGFSQKQWVILVVLLGLTIVVLLGAIIYALSVY
jgi:hypothetical protein